MSLNGHDEIFTYETEKGEEVKIKKVYLNSTEFIWYVYNELDMRWRRTKYEQLLNHYEKGIIKDLIQKNI